MQGRAADRGVRPYGGGKRRGGRDTWGPPYKFDFVRGDGRGRTPPLRITRGAVGRADVDIGPYGGVTRSAVQGRAGGQGRPPLRMHYYKYGSWQASARAGATEWIVGVDDSVRPVHSFFPFRDDPHKKSPLL